MAPFALASMPSESRITRTRYSASGLNDDLGRPKEMPDGVFPLLDPVAPKLTCLDGIGQFRRLRDDVCTSREIHFNAAALTFHCYALAGGRVDQSRISVPDVEYERCPRLEPPSHFSHQRFQRRTGCNVVDHVKQRGGEIVGRDRKVMNLTVAIADTAGDIPRQQCELGSRNRQHLFVGINADHGVSRFREAPGMIPCAAAEFEDARGTLADAAQSKY